MRITVSNEIRVQGAPADLVQMVRKELTMPNPEYTKKLRMGLWTGKTDPEIQLYYVNGDSIVLPCGAGGLLRPYLPDAEVVLDLADNGCLEYEGNIPLYDYQEVAVAEMKRIGGGILQSPCGSGKTQMGIALAARIGRKTLWVTHTQDLLNQSYERASQYLPEATLGKIAAGKVQIGTHMTFATVQTLSRLDLGWLKYMWDVVIVDECHRASGTPAAMHMFYKVMSSLAARYKFGLSATVHRSDGLIKSTFALLGPIMYRVPEEAVAEKTMRVTVVKRDTGVKPGREILDTDGTLVYSKLIPYLTENYSRNHLIVKDIAANAEHYNLIPSDRLEHLRALMAMLPEEVRQLAVMIDGTMTSKREKAKRENAIEEMRAGRKHFLFASYSLAKEGLDIPRLDRLYLATPKKDYAVVTQSIGRVARRFDGKQDAICYDYVDGIGFCENQYRRRKTSYRKAGCQIHENIQPDERGAASGRRKGKE